MAWLITILSITTISGVAGYIYIGKTEDAVTGLISTSIRCAYVLLQVVIILTGLMVVFMAGKWLMG